MFANSLFNYSIEPDKHGTGINPNVCGWSSSQAVPATGKKLAEDIRNEIEIFGGKQKISGVVIAPKKYEFLTIKKYFLRIYQDAHNIFLVQPKTGRRFESFRLCLWNPTLVNTQRRMSFPWFKTLVGPQPSIDEQVKKLISEVKILSIPYRETLASTLVTLFNDAKEEEPTIPGISPASLSNFYSFLQLHPNIKYPAISLTPDHDVYVSWRGKENRVLSLHFISDSDVSFVVFTPNDKHPERRIRISGITTTDVLMETLAPFSIWDWISNERG